MALYEPVDIDPTGRDGIGKEDDKWDDGKIDELEAKLQGLRQFNARLEVSPGKDLENNIILEKDKVRKDTIELISNQMYDKITKLFKWQEKKIRYKRRC